MKINQVPKIKQRKRPVSVKSLNTHGSATVAFQLLLEIKRETYVYHVKHPVSGNKLATVAIQQRGNMWCRGVAVLNPRDTFNYKKGRAKALGLLEAAFVRTSSSKPFGPRDAFHKNAKKTNDYNYRYIYVGALKGQPFFRCQRNVTLTDYELNTVLPKSVSSQFQAKANA